MKLLVAGFGKFENVTQNPSGDLALLANGKTYHHVEIRGIKLDVSWKTSWPELQKKIKELEPDAVLAFGLNASATEFHLENNAVNQADEIPDYFGKYPRQQLIAPQGPDTYSSGLPVEWLLEQFNARLRPSRITARISDDAGRYLCNYLFYSIMHNLDENIPWRGFVHMPDYLNLNDPLKAGYPKSDLLNAGLEIVKLVSKWMQEHKQLPS